MRKQRGIKAVLAGWLCAFASGRALGGTVNYTADPSDFPNPERGWYVAFYYYGHNNPGNDILNEANFQGALTASNNYSGDTNITLVQRVFDLQNYTSQALDSSVLNDVSSDLNTARGMGIKLILRFDYNEGPIGAPDAAESVILNHISQLAPILQANDDVIAYVEAGFIGTWGEWHDSTNGLTDPNNDNIVQGETDILDAEMTALPADRMIAVRYPGYTLEIFNTTSPISTSNAFNGSNYSRCGTHDDCFEVDAYDGGTYAKGTNLGWNAAQFKSYLGQQNLYAPECGESCGSSSYSGCSNSLADLSNEHWSALHCQYESSVIQGWVSGGCVNSIDLGLGYRYRLIQSTVPASVNQGGTLSMIFQVANDGFAACYNPRGLEVILRPVGQSGAGTAIYLTPTSADGTDPRFWQPGQTETASVSLALPGTLGTGNYNLLLNLPDPKPSLHDVPAYSVRLADLYGGGAIWESATGYNALDQTLAVVACPACSLTPTPTTTCTPTLTSTFTASPALSPSLTSTRSGTPTLTPASSLGQASPVMNVLRAVLVPNPAQGPDYGVAFDLDGAAEKVELTLYTAAMTEIGSQAEEGNYPAGWNQAVFRFPALSNGTYYYVLTAMGEGQKAQSRPGNLMVIR